MIVFFTDKAIKSINNIFNYSVYKAKDVFCQSFIIWLTNFNRDLNLIKNHNDKIFKYNESFYRDFNVIYIEFKYFYSSDNKLIVCITEINVKQWRQMLALCANERKYKNLKFKLQHASPNVNDYKYIFNKKVAGEINGNKIYYVQRKKCEQKTSVDFFNYLCNGKILSKYDFISPQDFVKQQDGEYKAKAAALRHNWYWVYNTPA